MRQVGFVGDAQGVGVFLNQIQLFIQRSGEIEHGNDQISVGDNPPGLLNGGVLDGVVGVADAGGVEEEDGQAVDVGDFADPVAGGAGDVGGDRAFLREKLVGESRFSDI